MTVYWPASVPWSCPLGTPVVPQQQTIVTEMDAGPPQVRRRFTATPESFAPQLVWTGDELAAFETWFAGDAAGGSTRFKVVHPRTRALVDCIFTGAPEPTPIAGGTTSEQLWSVRLPLLLLP